MKTLVILAWVVLAPALVLGAVGIVAVLGCFFVLIPLAGLFELWHRIFCFVVRKPYNRYFDI